MYIGKSYKAVNGTTGVCTAEQTIEPYNILVQFSDGGALVLSLIEGSSPPTYVSPDPAYDMAEGESWT